MRSRRALVLLTALACWSAPCLNGSPFHDGDDEEPRTFKEIVQRLVRASRENLRPLKTFRVEMHPGRTYWYEVDVVLPGAKTCRIYEHPRMVYRCEWEKPNNLPANTIYANVVKDLEEALGSIDWMAHQASNGSFVTRFEPVNPRRNPVFEVRIGGSPRDLTVEVLLFSVDRWGRSA